MSTKFKDSKLHEKRRRLNYETPSYFLFLCCANVVQITKSKNANQLINQRLAFYPVLGAGLEPAQP